MQGMDNLIAHGAIKQGNDCWHGVAWCYTKDIQHHALHCPSAGLVVVVSVTVPGSVAVLVEEPWQEQQRFPTSAEDSADIQKHCPAEHKLRSALPAQGKMALVQVWLAAALPLSMVYSWGGLC